MKSRILLFTICSALAFPAVRAADEAPSRHHEQHTELGDHMEKIGHAFRILSRQVSDAAKNEDSLKQVAIIRTNAAAAAKLQPAKTKDIPQDQQAKFLADYADQMKAFETDIESLESALKAGNNAEAAALVKKLKKDMDDSHKEFRKKKDEM